jgi:Rrf2 family transcriptional regulator, cysteine metabolism repressor
VKVSTRARYGTRAMVELAHAYPDGALSVKDVAARQRLSVKYLEQIMAPLKAAGIVKAVRGASGGYMLAQDPASVRLSDIYVALDGPPAIVDCVADAAICTRSAICPTRGVWCEMNAAVMKVLESTTLADLAARSAAAGTQAEAYCI